MLDNRIYTFLKLCETMNYRKTAELLNMTQPAVTQHIHHLEEIYHSKLFQYNCKKLSKTPACIQLEEYARTVIYNEQLFRSQLQNNEKQHIRIGATKTIGDYTMYDFVNYCLNNKDIQFELYIDNTKNLLKKLNNQELDFLIIEGYFNKSSYNFQLFKEEELVGICSKDHPFANKEISLNEIFNEHIILRESGSGTRDVFEHFLTEHNYSTQDFSRLSTINSLYLIQYAVEKNHGISFVYEPIPKNNKNITTFRLKNHKITHEFNYVFLKNSNAIHLFNSILNNNPNI